ncbi:DUF4300 family protein [Pseudoflavitalea sp. X16]|uniref:DUF4300 family protein n=1 Tax=Paraflavitalea devenefica TaxID=2716334 RepID=UPI0014213E79|nr:DUF4300 family protein [Paraflavitalea devenefica]NII29609.1 DUF4300 family protein [Paraflavitalea devenefica]
MDSNCTPAGNIVRYSCRCFPAYRYMPLLVAMLLSLAALPQCVSPSMIFKTPSLISGTGGTVGAIYKFSNVATGIDATIEIVNLMNGAGLNQMDNTSQGYYNAWQPYVTAGANDTSYLDWKITFKKAGTLADTILPCLSITAVDIDGDGNRLKEFIKASTPGAYAVDPNTSLNVSFDGTNSVAIGGVATVPSIDTSEKKYMFQMDFKNVSTILYRNGSISTKSTTDVRHTCIYFQSFFKNGLVILQEQERSNTIPRNDEQLAVNCPGISGRHIPVALTSPAAGIYRFSVYHLQGQELCRRSYAAHAGANRLQLELPGNSAAGIYILAVSNQQGAMVYRKRLLVR